jgi:hypothetical protein
VERLRAELAALRQDVENLTPSPSTEPDPEVDHHGEPSGGGITVEWPPEIQSEVVWRFDVEQWPRTSQMGKEGLSAERAAST